MGQEAIMITATRRRFTALALALGLVALSSCAEESTPDGQPESDSSAAAEVAALLVTAEDLGDRWSELVPDPDVSFEDGVVTDENREWLPRLEFCPAASAESQEAARNLPWQAFRQLNYDTGMAQPTAEPTPGSPPMQHHLVFLQEFLLRGDADDIEETYAALAAGMEACTDQTIEYPDGEIGRGEPFDVPALGDGSTGTRQLVAEPGAARRAATWDLRNVLVRDGEYLVSLSFAEITSPKVEPQFDDAAVEQLVETVDAKLP